MRTSELRVEEERRRLERKAAEKPREDARAKVVRFSYAEPWRGKAREMTESVFRDECGQKIFAERRT